MLEKQPTTFLTGIFAIVAHIAECQLKKTYPFCNFFLFESLHLALYFCANLRPSRSAEYLNASPAFRYARTWWET